MRDTTGWKETVVYYTFLVSHQVGRHRPPKSMFGHQVVRPCTTNMARLQSSAKMASNRSQVPTWRTCCGVGEREQIPRICRFPRYFGAMMSTNTHRTPKSDDSPGNAAEHREEEVWSGEDDLSEADDDGSGKRKRQKTSRPLSVSCELCKSRKVKCDRGVPRCGWCTRNGQTCEYRERKKPGLRAGK